MKDLSNRIQLDFTHIELRGNKKYRAKQLLEQAKRLALSLNAMCPHNREKSLALSRLEETIMWAQRSLAKAKYLPQLASENGSGANSANSANSANITTEDEKE